MDVTLKLIGKIHSQLKSIEDCPLQENENAPEAEIEIFPEFLEGIQNIKPGSQVLLLTWLHEADRSIIKCVPRNDFEAPRVGVFSTRSPDRPNPIGLHRVRVREVASGRLKVGPLEALDGTPIVDIKPVLAVDDC